MAKSIVKEMVRNADCNSVSSLSLERVGGGEGRLWGLDVFLGNGPQWASSCGVEKFLASVLLVLANALLEMGRVSVSQNPVIHLIMRVIFFVIVNHHWGLLGEFGLSWTRGGLRLGRLSTARSGVCCGT